MVAGPGPNLGPNLAQSSYTSYISPHIFFGGGLSIFCQDWARIFDCGLGPASDNIILANAGTSLDLQVGLLATLVISFFFFFYLAVPLFTSRVSQFEVYIGSTSKYLNIKNGWWRSYGAYAHVCATVDGSGSAHVFMNGLETGTGGVVCDRGNPEP